MLTPVERFRFKSLLCVAVLFSAMLVNNAVAPVYGNDAPKPNILWLVAEDLSPHLGCYGDTFATTPNIDRLASQGLRYLTCWSNTPVCAPARTSLLMGIHSPSMGAHHMRSQARIPASLKPYPLLLKEKGYYTTNNAKTDYNVTVNMREIWDESSNQAHWKNRQPGQPFFAVFNFEISHESRLRDRNTLEESRRHDPAKVPLPAYHPDAPEIRANWAQSYDRILQLDDQIQVRLNELEEAGLADDTIVFFFGDHGSGMPRSKRTVLNTGLNTPLIVRIPEKFRHLAPPEYAPNGVSDRVVSFVDFPPTLLSLIGEKAPETMHGKPFMGKYDAGPQPYVFGSRDRMDERIDASRAVRDTRFVLALNLYPHIPFGAYQDYMFQTQTAPAWRKLYDEGKLPPEQAFFFNMKPPIELYDLQTDPDQVRNLAYLPEYAEIRNRLLNALLTHMCETRDLGFLPEAMFWERTQETTPYELAHNQERYDLKTIMNAWLRHVSMLPFSFGKEGLAGAPGTADYQKDMNSEDDAVRYWVAVGLLYRLAKTAGADGTKPTEETSRLLEEFRPALERLTSDGQRIVRIPVAEALGRYGTDADVTKAVDVLFEVINEMDENPAVYFFRTLLAFNSMDYFSDRVTDPGFAERANAGSALPTSGPGRPAQTFERIVKSILR